MHVGFVIHTSDETKKINIQFLIETILYAVIPLTETICHKSKNKRAYIMVQNSNRSARIFLETQNSKNLKIATIKQVIVYLSKLLEFIFRKSHI